MQPLLLPCILGRMTNQAALQFPPSTASELSLSSLLNFTEGGIVSRTLLASDSLRVVLFALAKGQELTEHTSARRALVQVVSGSCEFLYNGKWAHLEPGSLLHMPAGHVHAVKAVSDNCGLLLTLSQDVHSTASAVTEAASEANA